MVALHMPDSKDVDGLRQQIIANAEFLFPILDMYVEDPKKAFDVLLVASGSHDSPLSKAILVRRIAKSVERKILAESAETPTLKAALCSLLDVTAQAFRDRGKHMLVGMTGPQKVGGGAIDSCPRYK